MRRTRGRCAAAIVVSAMALAACSNAASDDRRTGTRRPVPGPARVDRVAGLVGGMSVEQKVGQLFIPTIPGTTPAAGAALVRKYHLGGVIYFPANLRGPAQTARLSNGLQRASGNVPLLVGTDEEQGNVSRLPYITHFPANRALASSPSADADVRTAARVTAEELRAVGVNQNFAPVADVNVNPRNPIIGIRSFGRDPRKVAHFVGIAVDAYRAAGVAATAKHFPGHGDTATDSHTGLPVITHSMSTWRRLDAPPFKAAIDHRIDAIMTAHIVVPGLDRSREPATMSRAVLTGLLRGRLGFTGVVVTDSLQMAGATKKHGAAGAAVRAVRAGADMLLMPRSIAASYRAVLRAVRSGAISRARLDDAVTRVLRMKERRGLFANRYTDVKRADAVVGSAAHRAAARQVAARTR